jgi:hypothetical protein
VRDAVRRMMAALLPWYDPDQVDREARHTEQIRKLGAAARRQALREQYAAADERLGRMSGR